MTFKLLRSVAGTGLVTILLSMNIACKKSKDNNDTPITPRTDITANIAGDSWLGLNYDKELPRNAMKIKYATNRYTNG